MFRMERGRIELAVVFLIWMVPTVIAMVLVHVFGVAAVVAMGVFFVIGILVSAFVKSTGKCQNLTESQPVQEQNVEEDCPPSYEVVTSKPPPYSLLYVSDSLPGGSREDVESASSSAHMLPDAQHNKNVEFCHTWTVTDPESSPPSYPEAVNSSFGGIPHTTSNTTPTSTLTSETTPVIYPSTSTLTSYFTSRTTTPSSTTTMTTCPSSTTCVKVHLTD
ncbi:cell wall protein DAN4-like isoform X2 [Homarus americanus]|uniref:cell wall protein DAN4-like isoform X2 n=1 Tax=Homarus americanus TaxID=6706 RepID=UPI001C4763C6|nr:cell wall protein DAN4-like isoform X2 [Homarus americanus]